MTSTKCLHLWDQNSFFKILLIICHKFNNKTCCLLSWVQEHTNPIESVVWIQKDTALLRYQNIVLDAEINILFMYCWDKTLVR